MDGPHEDPASTPPIAGPPSPGTEPPAHAFTGLSVPVLHPAPAGSMGPQDDEIADAVAAGAGWMTDVLARLVAEDTTLGNEASGQVAVRETLRELGLEPVDVPMDAEALRAHPQASPFDWDVSGAANVVAAWQPREREAGLSLILNGHIDVVSAEPRSRWEREPFTPWIDGDWLSGRGAADMKCGLAAILGAVRGLRELGLSPGAAVTIESVVEEECTGNGTLQTLLAGYAADAAIIAEPFGAAITTSQVGVLWFDVVVQGQPGHAADSAPTTGVIESSLEVIRVLRALEAELNAAPPPPYDGYAHPIALNVGQIHAGDWNSTAPGECVTGFRLATYPGTPVGDLRARIEAVLAQAAVEDPVRFPTPPVVRYRGFAADGYEVPQDHLLVNALSAAYTRHVGAPPSLVATTGTTDARVFGLAGGIPSVCFGPYAEGAHGVGERVYLPSVVQTAQVMGLFIKDWCGVS